MKNLTYINLLLALLISVSSCTTGEQTTAKEGENKNPELLAKRKGANSKCVFEKELYDLGKIQQGEIVKYTMKFRNEGEDPLVINSARASCGCTVPKWTKKPIAKGEEGQLEITFDTSGRNGKQHKSVMLITNSAEKIVEVSFVAEVVTN